jgi:Uma2 family endonuclease
MVVSPVDDPVPTLWANAADGKRVRRAFAAAPGGGAMLSCGAMSAVMRRPMSLEAFLDWEERQPVPWEFDGFGPVAMTGGTLEHATIQSNLLRAVGNRLAGGPCRVFGSHLKIQVAGSIRYPDAFVACGEYARGVTVLDTPVVLFEILSPGTATVDRVVKNAEYRATASIRRYVMLEQDRMAATVFQRAGDDWIGHLLTGDVALDMPEIGVSVPLAELYEGVAFPAEEA